jgi:hypothetical protein
LHGVEEARGLFGQLGIGGHRRELVLPQVEILAREGGEVRLVGHDARL